MYNFHPNPPSPRQQRSIASLDLVPAQENPASLFVCCSSNKSEANNLPKLQVQASSSLSHQEANGPIGSHAVQDAVSECTSAN